MTKKSIPVPGRAVSGEFAVKTLTPDYAKGQLITLFLGNRPLLPS